MPMAGSPNLLLTRGFFDLRDRWEGLTLSEKAWACAVYGRRATRDWRSSHDVDQELRGRFARAALWISELNKTLHRGSYRLNVILTLNIGQIANAARVPNEVIQRQTLQNLRNCYRNSRHSFSGIWRREVFGKEKRGEHLHLLTHAPRGMRDRFLEKLPVWANDPLDTARTSRRFDRKTWRAVGMSGTWHLGRIYELEGVLDYLAKVPIDENGQLVSRPVRLRPVRKGAREFAIFGVKEGC